MYGGSNMATTSLQARIAELEELVEQLELENETLQSLLDQGQDLIDDLTEQNSALLEESKDFDAVPEEYLAGTFVGTPNRKHFHRPDCKWLRGISFVIQFPSHEAAVKAGRKPCKTCRA
jgi:hypothetical protein